MLGRLVACSTNTASPATKRFSRSKTGAVLGWLAYHLDQDHGREVLAERLWPDASADAARHNLNQAIYRLRQEFSHEESLSEPLVVGNHLHVRLNPERVSTDVQAFRSLLRRASSLGKRAEADGDRDERIDLLAQAIELYRGDLLPGYYEEWVLIERERLVLQFVDTVVEILDLLARANALDQAMQIGLRAAAVMPCHEELSVALMRLYQTVGKPIDGLREYVRLGTALRRHEGRDPGAGANALAVSLKRQAREMGLQPPRPRVRRSPARPTTGQPAARETANPLAESTQGHPRAHSSPAAHGAGDATRQDWPRWRSRLVGREEELDRLVSLLPLGPGPEQNTLPDAEGATRRLVTVTGAAGAGKTRLVVEAVDRIRRSFAGDVAYIPLAEMADPTLVVDRIAQSLGAAGRQMPVTVRTVAAGIGDKSVLLVLDNVEHLLPAAADTVLELLDGAPGLVCLCTSRVPLGIEAEQVLPLAPLNAPNPEDGLSAIRESPAVRLFLDRAQLVRPELHLAERNAAVIAALCRRLDGLPLAIELAAARANVLTPLQMLERMADRFGFLVSSRGRPAGRHQTLQDAVVWSYDLLSPEAKRVFIQLSVFCGGWSLEAAEAVCAVSHGGSEPARCAGGSLLDHLQLLVDRSMVQFSEHQGDGRYSMLQTLRDFASAVSEPITVAVEPLSPDGLRSAAQERHARYFGDLALAAESSLRGDGASETHAKLSLDDENLDAALDRTMASPAHAGTAPEVCAALWRYWYWRGATRKARARLDASLDLLGRSERPHEQSRIGDTILRTRLLLGLGGITRLEGDFELASKSLMGAAAECEEVRDHMPLPEYQTLRGHICQQLAILHEERGETDLAIAWQEEALGLFHALSDARGVATSHGNLGRNRQKAGELSEARACYELALAEYDRLGDTLQCAVVWNNIGSAANEQGDYLGAKLAFETSAAMFRALGNPRAMVIPQCNLGDTLTRLGALEQAAAVLAEGLELRRQTGDVIGQCYVLVNLGTIAAKQGDYEGGICLLTAGRSILRQRNAPLSAAANQSLEDDLAECRGNLTSEQFEAAIAFGENLPLNSAIQIALRPHPINVLPPRSSSPSRHAELVSSELRATS